jgi:hypothetical protein
VSPLKPWRDRTVLTVSEARDGPFDGQVSLATIYEQIKAGKIPSIHLGARILIPVAPLRELLGDS